MSRPKCATKSKLQKKGSSKVRIEPPVPDVRLALARKFAEGLVGIIPFAGSSLVGIYSVTHPSQADQVAQKWQNNITDAVNQLEQVIAELAPTIRISDEAANFAVYLARMCKYGHGKESIDLPDATDAIPGASQEDLIELCGELESLGLISTTGALGMEIVHIRPTITLFEVFDEIAIGSDPQHDAMTLAKFLSENKSLSSEDYVTKSGWSVRRYNPAMAMVCQMIGEGRISKTKSREYYSGYCFTTPSERAELKRFAMPISGSVN